MVKVNDVRIGSIADEVGIKPGDIIININGQVISDYIDYSYLTADDYFSIMVKKTNNEIWEYDIELSPGEELGLIFEEIIYDKLKLCKNNCLFCFVKQQPGGLRETLNIKDDDYRFSFLQGSFITLTNLSEDEINRIINYKLSPINISVHTTNPELRIEMMKNPAAGKIMEQLTRLARENISFNTQIVLCPGFNDKKELDKTINDLLSLYPATISIGVVPVGLTKFRNGLAELKSYQSKTALSVLKQINKWQQTAKDKYGQNIIYTADEFYLLSGVNIPDAKNYNGFPQMENGIGLTRLLWDELDNLDLSETLYKKRSIAIITSVLGEKAMLPVCKKLNLINKLNVKLIKVNNNFFGSDVTVTGLLTGSDIIKTLKEETDLPVSIILPSIMLNDDGFFLDNLKVIDLVENFPELNFYLCSNLNDILEVIRDGKTCCSNSRKT